jgi:hypothetical protein
LPAATGAAGQMCATETSNCSVIVPCLRPVAADYCVQLKIANKNNAKTGIPTFVNRNGMTANR